MDPLHGSNDCHLHVCDSLEAAAKAAAADPALNAVFVYPDVYTGANNTDVSMRGLLLAGLLDPAADASAPTRPIFDGQYADVRILEVLPSTTVCRCPWRRCLFSVCYFYLISFRSGR